MAERRGLMPPPPLPKRSTAPAAQPGCSTLPPSAAPLTATGLPSTRKKIALAPGHSALDWARLTASMNLGTGAREITMEEVRGHNTRDDAWMTLRGRVYDITPYLKFHPGGVAELMRAAGGQGDSLFDEIHPWVNADFILAKCCIGVLARGESKKMTAVGGSFEPKAAAPAPAPSPAPAPASAPVVAGDAGAAVGEATAAAAAAVGASAGAGTSLSADEWVPATLEKREALTSNSVRLTLRFPEGIVLGWRAPVEHVELRFRDESGADIVRPYTPLWPSSPATASSVDLAIKVYASGKMSRHVGVTMAVGDCVDIRFRPCPLTVVRSVVVEWGGRRCPASTMVLLAGGTGIMPMLQLLNAAVTDAAPVPEIHLVYTNSSLSTVMFGTQLARISASVPSLHVTYVVSSLDAGTAGLEPAEAAKLMGGWESKKVRVQEGRLTQELLSDVLPPPSADTFVSWCGPPGFGEAMDQAMRRLYFVAAQFFPFD